MGFYRNGKFNLVVSVRYIPTDQELSFLCAMFQQVSKILYDATDGQQSIGYIQIATNSLAGNDADIWIHPNDDVWPNSTSARLWIANESLDMSQDYNYFPTIMAHELSHYLYDLRDEYNNNTSCQNDITTQASLMEGYDWDVHTRWTDGSGNDYATFADFIADFNAGTAVLQMGQPTEFCHAGNHNATANNNQNNLNNNQSCWTYLGDNANHGNLPYNLTIPGAGGPALNAPSPDPPPAVCVELISAQRYMLVLDRSGSMFGNKIEQLKAGAHFWVDYVHSGEELGLVTFSGVANLSSGMSSVPAGAASQNTWRNDRHTIVEGLNAGGTTAIGDALRIGLTNILDAGSAAEQVIILFTDGLQNAGSETAEEVLPDAIAANVKIYTIGLGADHDVALLTNIADATGGVYFGIPSDVSDTAAADAISDALVQVSGHSRSNSGIKSFSEVDGSAVSKILKPDLFTVPFVWADPATVKKPKRVARIESFSFPVDITPGTSRCNLGVKWYDRQLSYRVRVIDPSGVVVVPGTTVRHISGKNPYSFYDIQNPRPGTWQVEVFGNIRASKFRTIGFEVNPNIKLEVAALKSIVRAGEIIRLRAKLKYGFALGGVKMQAIVRSPSGKIQKINFFENTGDKEEERLYTAEIKTNKAEQGQYMITVAASHKATRHVFKRDEFYVKKPGLKNKETKLKVPDIYRQKTIVVRADRMGDCRCDEKEPVIHGYNTKDVWVHPRQKELLKKWKQQQNKGRLTK